MPELAFRVPSGCKPHPVEPVPFEQVFAVERGASRDVHFSTDALLEAPPDQGSSTPRAGEWPRRRRRLLGHVPHEMAEHLAAVRELLEARPSAPREAAPFWTPRQPEGLTVDTTLDPIDAFDPYRRDGPVVGTVRRPGHQSGLTFCIFAPTVTTTTEAIAWR